jgi:hypothetical protein
MSPETVLHRDLAINQSLGFDPGANLPALEEPEGVAASSQVRVVLDLDADGDLICGSISTADHAPHQFFGWLELADELEGVRKSVRDDLGVGSKRVRLRRKPVQA